MRRKTPFFITSFFRHFMVLDAVIKLSVLGIVLITIGFLMVSDSSSTKSSARVTEETVLKTEIEEPANVLKGRVSKGESLYQIIVKHSGDRTEAVQVGAALKERYDPRSIKTGDEYTILFSSRSSVREFTLMPNPFIKYTIKKENGWYVSSEEKIKISTNIVGIKGLIKNSLYESLIQNGVKPEIIVNFAEIFAWDIDFFSDTRNNDSFWIVWEEHTTDNGHSYPGTILGAEYHGKMTKLCRAVYFKNAQGNAGYYDLSGKSLRRCFLKAPLNFRRISSYFSHRRFHPILRYYRPHTGIDYAAPTGTPVVAIGDGMVAKKGWNGQGGRSITIKHNSVYESTYNHFSGYAKNIAPGVRIRQGQVIGYVGSSGLATGPHLDFRFKKFGSPINFLKLKLPPEGSVAEKDMADFKNNKQQVLQKAAMLTSNDRQQVVILQKE